MKLEYLGYHSGDCPLVRIYDLSTESVALLVSRAMSLYSGKMDSFELHTLTGVEPLMGLTLKAAVGKDIGLVRCGSGLDFETTLAEESWAQVAGLAEPFMEKNSEGGFQWLDHTSDIPLLISGYPGGVW